MPRWYQKTERIISFSSKGFYLRKRLSKESRCDGRAANA